MSTVKSFKKSAAYEQIINSLHNKSEAELKVLYAKLFQSELKDEWKTITKSVDFNKMSEAEIVKTIQKNRYRN